MSSRSVILFAAAAAVLCTGPVLAEEQPVVTAAQPSVADQIDAYLKSSPVREIPSDGVDGVVTAEPDRKIHGEVSVGVGSHGYRSVYMRAEAPIGDRGQVSVAFEDTRFRGRVGHFGGRSLGLGLGVGAGMGDFDRNGCDLDAFTPPRPAEVTGAPYGRCVGLPRR